MSKKKETVLVAMSGGVDSSVAAALLKRRGYDVIGLTMQIWQESQTDPRHAGCCSLGAVEDARRVARVLDIPHYVMNFKEEFRKSVIDHFADEYGAGRTPNPCVRCNKEVKFDILLRKMRELGCSRLVTGHYARIRKDAQGIYWLLKAAGSEKDQSYVLYNLDQEQLSQSSFPLGEMPNKDAVRALARELGLSVADKPDSQEICFVSEAGGYQDFLRKTRPDLFREGEVVDQEGRSVGKHDGVAAFTVGQRRGLGVSSAKPLYVLELLPKENRVVVGDADRLLAKEAHLIDLHWAGSTPPEARIRVEAKIRYNMQAQPATLLGAEGKLVFDEPVRSVTPGQIAVAYRGKRVVAGGVVARASAG